MSSSSAQNIVASSSTLTTTSNVDSKDNNIDDSESIASDESEEMIEVDEDEFDSRRAICIADMKELESQFLKLKEELIYEKQMLIEQKLKEIEDESAEEYTTPSLKLKQNMEIKIKLTSLLRDYRLKNLEHLYQYEVMSIKQSLENDKAMLFDKQISKIETEIRQLEENKRQFLLDYNLFKINQNGCFDDGDILLHELTGLDNHQNEDNDNENINNNDFEEETQQQEEIPSKKSKKCSKKTTSPASNPVIMPGAPYIVYSLQDYDILEDWSIIKMHNNIKNGTST